MVHSKSNEAAQACDLPVSAASDLIEKAAVLINPASGIANDFLNHFNEILLLIENLPILLPEMVDELMQWRPTTYAHYFERSSLPGRFEALASYRSIDPGFRDRFDATVDRLNQMAVRIIHVIGCHRAEDGEIAAEVVADFCASAANEFREALLVASNMVDAGAAVSSESAQCLADRLLAQ